MNDGSEKNAQPVGKNITGPGERKRARIAVPAVSYVQTH